MSCASGYEVHVPLKILLTVHQFFPDYFSGTEVLTRSVAKELLRRGHQVAVLTGFPAGIQLKDFDRFDEYEFEGIQIFRFHHAYVPMGDQDVVTEIEFDNQLAAQYFARVVTTFAPDVIHFFHLSRLGGGLIDVAVTAGIPAYYTPTDFWSVCPTSQLLLHDGKMCAGPLAHAGNCVKHVAELTRRVRAKGIVRLVPDAIFDVAAKLTAEGLLPPYPLSREVSAMSQRRDFLVARVNWLDGIVSPTQLMSGVLRQNGVDGRLIVNSAYGIDTGGYGTAPPVVARGQALTIGFIGTMAPHKGCHILVEAFKRLAPGSAQLKLYGNPADFPDYHTGLQQRAAGSDNITFCGTFPNGEIGAVLAGLHVLVVPSLWYENAPLVVYSALAAKRPVVASDFPGLSENIKDGVNGLIFPPGDFKALHARLNRLIAEPELLANLSANCRPPKSTAEYVDELLALYTAGPRTGLAPSEGRKARNIPPLDFDDKGGVLSGWAVTNLTTPARVAVQVGGITRGETKRFLPRSDVRDSLRRGGASVKTNAFGFIIKLPSGIDRNTAILQCEAPDGRLVLLPFREITCGSSVHMGGDDYVAIDSERLMWQAEGPNSSPQ